METITIPKEKFVKVLSDVEILIEDIGTIFTNEEEIVQKRVKDIEDGEINGKSEAELDKYLKKRGVKID